MSYLKLSKRATNGKLIKCTNFVDGSYINLIQLQQPYKDGTTFSVHETTYSPFCSNGLFKTLENAINKYETIVSNGANVSKILSQYDSLIK